MGRRWESRARGCSRQSPGGRPHGQVAGVPVVDRPVPDAGGGAVGVSGGRPCGGVQPCSSAGGASRPRSWSARSNWFCIAIRSANTARHALSWTSLSGSSSSLISVNPALVLAVVRMPSVRPMIARRCLATRPPKDRGRPTSAGRSTQGRRPSPPRRGGTCPSATCRATCSTFVSGGCRGIVRSSGVAVGAGRRSSPDLVVGPQGPARRLDALPGDPFEIGQTETVPDARDDPDADQATGGQHPHVVPGDVTAEDPAPVAAST